MRNLRFRAALLAAPLVAASLFAAPAPASAAPAVTDLDCGIFACSWVFSKSATKLISEGAPAIRVCKNIPTPGNLACGVAIAALVVTAKKARSEGKCAKITWTKTPAPPLGTWWPSVEGGKRCK
jgi:drug/metabolite transporter (DMT)-like permease